MKRVTLLSIAAMGCFLGCSTEYDAHNQVSITLSNKSDGAVSGIKVCIENTSDCQQITEFGATDSVMKVFTLPPGDGGFVYSSLAANEPYIRRFGYFSNGYAMTKVYHIQIHSADSISISQ